MATEVLHVDGDLSVEEKLSLFSLLITIYSRNRRVPEPHRKRAEISAPNHVNQGCL